VWAAARQLRAPPAIRQLRDLTRYRKRLIQAHGAECQRIQKTLEDAGIKQGLGRH
jgi:transposase